MPEDFSTASQEVGVIDQFKGNCESHLSATKPRSSNIIPVEQQCFHSINTSLLHFVPITSRLGRGKILEGDTAGKIVPN